VAKHAITNAASDSLQETPGCTSMAISLAINWDIRAKEAQLVDRAMTPRKVNAQWRQTGTLEADGGSHRKRMQV